MFNCKVYRLEYVCTEPLENGTKKPKGITLNVITNKPYEIIKDSALEILVMNKPTNKLDGIILIECVVAEQYVIKSVIESRGDNLFINLAKITNNAYIHILDGNADTLMPVPDHYKNLKDGDEAYVRINRTESSIEKSQ